MEPMRSRGLFAHVGSIFCYLLALVWRTCGGQAHDGRWKDSCLLMEWLDMVMVLTDQHSGLR